MFPWERESFWQNKTCTWMYVLLTMSKWLWVLVIFTKHEKDHWSFYLAPPQLKHILCLFVVNSLCYLRLNLGRPLWFTIAWNYFFIMYTLLSLSPCYAMHISWRSGIGSNHLVFFLNLLMTMIPKENKTLIFIIDFMLFFIINFFHSTISHLFFTVSSMHYT